MNNNEMPFPDQGNYSRAMDKDGFPTADAGKHPSETSAGNNLGNIPDVLTDVKSNQEIIASEDNRTQFEDFIQMVPTGADLSQCFTEAGQLVDDIVLKKYLTRLSELDITPLDNNLKDIEAIRFFRISEMVYQNDEPALPKFASVFNAAQPLHCAIYLLAISDGAKTDFYMGIRGLDNLRTAKSLKDTLRNALIGQFPGVKTEEMKELQIKAILEDIKYRRNIAAVSSVAQEKKLESADESSFVQGLEKFVMAMQGQEYAMLVLAKSADQDQLNSVRNAYESIYAGLSPFASMQISYSISEAETISQSLSSGISSTQSINQSNSRQWSTAKSKSEAVSKGQTTPDRGMNIAKILASGVITGASAFLAPFTGGTSLVAGAGINMLLGGLTPGSTNFGHTTNYGTATTEGGSNSTSYGESTTHSSSQTEGTSKQTSHSQNVQLTRQNKIIQDTLQRLDGQLKRLDQCESQGMWESAAYFLSDSQESAEMAASTYRSLMSGENSGLETSAINFWPSTQNAKINLLHEYLCNFLHPVFIYQREKTRLPVTAATFISGNELALQMGLPRSSVRGFPVIKHAEFGLEALRYAGSSSGKSFVLGNIQGMGRDTGAKLEIDIESMTAHTLVCGSTGSGKSNTVFEILCQLSLKKDIPFLIIEPAKGEYKHYFADHAHVYGTNPQKFKKLLRINPFSFPHGIHILEHLDRLVEAFNVSWPMYAAMPAVLKDAIERAYVSKGWNLTTSENPREEIYPDFNDLLAQIKAVIDESQYSAETRGDYIGALSTRVRSLTTGLNGMIFSEPYLTDSELFDENAIIDLSRIGSMETRALIMGLLITRLNEYRMGNLTPNQHLRHVTVLEEAHNLLKRTSTEQFMESANPIGKAVELLSSSIAEMRAFGEAFVIVDQSPNMLDQSAIRNTNTKIILRLPDQSDRELVGRSANLNDQQIEELAKLERGVAAVYQNDWIQPVLAKINGCSLAEKIYNPNSACEDNCKIWRNFINFAIEELAPGNLEIHLEKIEEDLSRLPRPLRDNVNEILELNYKALTEHTPWRKSRHTQHVLAELAGFSAMQLDPGLYYSIEQNINNSSTLEQFDLQFQELLETLTGLTNVNQLNELKQCVLLQIAATKEKDLNFEAFFRDWRIRQIRM